ASAENMETM
nr:Chain C, NP366-N3A variant peptide from influenza virus [synthetic construct]